jgi:hypothetical protein
MRNELVSVWWDKEVSRESIRISFFTRRRGSLPLIVVQLAAPPALKKDVACFMEETKPEGVVAFVAKTKLDDGLVRC